MRSPRIEGWLGTIATRDREHIAAGLESLKQRFDRLNPTLRAVAERAIADARR